MNQRVLGLTPRQIEPDSLIRNPDARSSLRRVRRSAFGVRSSKKRSYSYSCSSSYSTESPGRSLPRRTAQRRGGCLICPQITDANRTRKEGEDALALSHDFRVLAAKCSERLKPFGKTIWDATEFYLEHLERTKDSILVPVTATDYQESKKRAKLSEKHLADIRLRLGRFVATFGNMPIRSIAAAEIETWLHDLALSPQSINNYRVIVGAFFEYALRRELVVKNPVAAIDKVKLVDKAAEIFTSKQLADLLVAAPQSLLRHRRAQKVDQPFCVAEQRSQTNKSEESAARQLGRV